MKEPVAWTDQWVRELTWRTVRRINSDAVNNGIPPSGIERSRILRVLAKLKRRKREGGGGWAARLKRIRESEP